VKLQVVREASSGGRPHGLKKKASGGQGHPTLKVHDEKKRKFLFKKHGGSQEGQFRGFQGKFGREYYRGKGLNGQYDFVT